MRSLVSPAITLALFIVPFVGGARGDEFIRLVNWTEDNSAYYWPASSVVSASSATDLAQADPACNAELNPGAPPAQFCADAPCASEDCCFDFDVCTLPCRYVQLDGLLWHRVGTGCSEVLVIDTDNNAPLLNTDDLHFDLTGGTRLLIGWQPDPCRGCQGCCAWELSYFGLFGSNASGLVTGAGDLAIPGDLGLASNNFFNADIIDIDYSSSLHNLELNCVKSCCLDDCRLDALCGFRYILLSETFTLTGTDFQEGTSSYTIDANNHLLGLQVGGRMTRAWCRWSFELTGKAGVFYNAANQHQVVTDFPNGPPPFVLRDAQGNGSAVAMLGELGVVFTRPLNDCWSLRLGYNVLGLGGVALAPDQLDFTDTFASGTDLHTNGWIFAHGGIVGVQRTW